MLKICTIALLLAFSLALTTQGYDFFKADLSEFNCSTAQSALDQSYVDQQRLQDYINTIRDFKNLIRMFYDELCPQDSNNTTTSLLQTNMNSKNKASTRLRSKAPTKENIQDLIDNSYLGFDVDIPEYCRGDPDDMSTMSPILGEAQKRINNLLETIDSRITQAKQKLLDCDIATDSGNFVKEC